MGQPLTIENMTNEDVYIEWKSSPGGIFNVAAYSIGARQKRSHTAEAWWYDIYFYHKGNKLVKTFNGSVAASWKFHGVNIYHSGYRQQSVSPIENGVLTVPLDHPVVKSIVSYFQSLEVKPSIQQE